MGRLASNKLTEGETLMVRPLAFSVFLLALTIFGTAFGAENAPGVTTQEIKIGGIFPFSGPASAYSTAGKGLAAYIDYLNDKGGINGRKIKFIALDDAYSPPKTVEQTRKLVEGEEVAFMFGIFGTPSNAAVIKYLNSKKIPDLFIISGGSKFTDFKEYPYTTTGIPSYETEGRIYAKYIAKSMPAARVALLYQNDDLGKDYLNAFKAQFGGDFDTKVFVESYETTEPTIDSHVINLKSKGAEVFLIAATPKFAAQAIRKAHELGWTPLRILSQVSNSIASVLKPVGPDMSKGVVSATYFKDVTDPKFNNDAGVMWYRELLTRYAPGSDPTDLFYITGINQGLMLEQVLKQCGDDLSRENIIKQSRSIKELSLALLLPGITINTSEKNSQAFTQLVLQRFNGTSWEVFGDVIGVSE
jgi:ABC-type branched-subunit amino acid transport system substrate-binding protein